MREEVAEMTSSLPSKRIYFETSDKMMVELKDCEKITRLTWPSMTITRRISKTSRIKSNISTKYFKLKNRPISSPTTNHSPSYTHQILPAHNVSLFPASVDTYNNLGWLIFPASCVLDSIDGSTYNSCMTEVIAVIDTNVLVHAIIGALNLIIVS